MLLQCINFLTMCSPQCKRETHLKRDASLLDIKGFKSRIPVTLKVFNKEMSLFLAVKPSFRMHSKN